MSSLALSAQTLTFNGVQFDVVTRSNQPWLSSPQIGDALGYVKGSRSVHKIYESNKDEFTESMTALVKLKDLNPQNGDAGQMREVRIFSLRGCHLLAMLARTKVAKEFRKWVLDVLDGLTSAKPARQTKALPSGLTVDQQTAIKALVKARVEVLPKESQAKAAITCWSSLKSKFGCTYKEISAEQYVDAVSLVARLPLEGDYLPASDQSDSIVIDLDASTAQHNLRLQGDLITLDAIQDGYIGGNPLSRLFMLLSKAANEGKPVQVKSVVGAQAIWMATKELAWNTRHALLDIQRMAEGGKNRGVRLGHLIKE